VLVDAAQSAGHVPVDLASDGADLVAVTGHKGLLGPQGTGGLWVREGIDVDPLLCGGTGGNSALRDMPSAMPDHLEAGTPNAPGIAGLLAGSSM
jgi:cysteine desulfurase / selenocysteine lyase